MPKTTGPHTHPGIIHVMPEALANKIAAGEVVQRPASAVKELVENAIDAGATDITVIAKGAGSDLIQVVDNGSGMTVVDATACFQRHATSKIRDIHDLERIRTLGFRGEALASIAAVSQVELKTKRQEDAAGTMVRIEGGEVLGTEPCATSGGTSVAVRNLFFNVPARRSFLKTPATEFKHIVDIFQSLALSNPAIAFRLVHQENEVFRLTATEAAASSDALQTRIRQLFGEDLGVQLVEVSEETSYLTIRGFVGRPSSHRRSRGEQFLFVNDRYVSSRYLDHAVLKAYGDALSEGSYPFFALYLSLDPRHVDVNVHPAKAEVKFDDERGVYGFVRAVVKKAIGVADLTPQFEPGAMPAYHHSPNGPGTAGSPLPWRGAGDDSGHGPRPAQGIFSSGGGFARRDSASSPGMPPHGMTPGDLAERLYAPGHQPNEQGGVVASGATEEETEGESVASVPILWQLHERYILTQIRSGLMIVDQNAAHERVLYERALESMKNGFGLSQQLLFPHTLEFSAADYELLKELLPDLRSLGFDIEPFSGRSVMVRGVPTDIRAGDERQILEDILDQFKHYRDRLQIKGRENLARSMARRSAIRPGRKLDTKEMRALIDVLFTCEMPYVCPHGRPTMVKISVDELDRRFGRVGEGLRP